MQCTNKSSSKTLLTSLNQTLYINNLTQFGIRNITVPKPHKSLQHSNNNNNNVSQVFNRFKMFLRAVFSIYMYTFHLFPSASIIKLA